MNKIKCPIVKEELSPLHDFKKQDVSVINDEIVIKHETSYYKFSKKQVRQNITECRDLMLFTGLISLAVCLITYLVLGFVLNENSYGFSHFWMIFILVPIAISLVEVIYKKQIVRFNVAALTALVYAYLGMFKNLWHPCWIIFIVPIIYYIAGEYIDKKNGYKYLDEAIKIVDDERISKYRKEN